MYRFVFYFLVGFIMVIIYDLMYRDTPGYRNQTLLWIFFAWPLWLVYRMYRKVRALASRG